MRILTPPGAQYFCENFTASGSTSGIGMTDYLDSLPGIRKFTEGDNYFDELRDLFIREAERNTFLSISCYQRSLRSLRASSAYWAIVGLYYSCFFGAKALVAMHGGWMGKHNAWLEVTAANPGDIEITYRKTKHPALKTARVGGSHRIFWTVFYNCVKPLYSYIDADKQFSVEPVHSSDTWLIDTRNELNYQSTLSFKMLDEFLGQFDASDIPNCLPGDLNVFINISGALIELVTQFQGDYNFSGDAFASSYPSFTDAINGLIIDNAPPELEVYCSSIT